MTPHDMTPYDGFGVLAAILVMAVATYAMRAGGFWLMAFVPLTPRLRRMIEALAGSVVVAAVPACPSAGHHRAHGVARVVPPPFALAECRNLRPLKARWGRRGSRPVVTSLRSGEPCPRRPRPMA